jgi:hypothetical protein
LKDIETIIADLEQQRSAIDRAISALREVTGVRASTKQAAPPRRGAKKRQLSPEGRARIAEATRRRWAAQRAAVRPAGKTARGRKAAGKKAAKKTAESAAS